MKCRITALSGAAIFFCGGNGQQTQTRATASVEMLSTIEQALGMAIFLALVGDIRGSGSLSVGRIKNKIFQLGRVIVNVSPTRAHTRQPQNKRAALHVGFDHGLLQVRERGTSQGTVISPAVVVRQSGPAAELAWNFLEKRDFQDDIGFSHVQFSDFRLGIDNFASYHRTLDKTVTV
jgi:hypothetical protein